MRTYPSDAMAELSAVILNGIIRREITVQTPTNSNKQRGLHIKRRLVIITKTFKNDAII